MDPSKQRIALYSAGMVGLGHMRRQLLVAHALAGAQPPAAILMLAETRQASVFALPPGADCVTLPALRKDRQGQCEPRYLDVPLEDAIAIRRNAVAAALAAFEPDVLIVDHLAWGALGELRRSLDSLRARGRARCVLGLRDVLEDPATVAREWGQAGTVDAIRACYDAVWIYGDPRVYDAVREYCFPADVAAKVRFTGYLDQLPRLDAAAIDTANTDDLLERLALPPGRLALCLLGGGQDGVDLAEAFAQADLPPDTNGLLVTGPFMPDGMRRRLRRQAAAHPRRRVLELVDEPGLLLRRADRVVAMGGYNTVCEVLSHEKRSLIVPRAGARREQLIRAERLRELGLVDLLPADELTPEALAAWLRTDLPAPPRARELIDLNGVERLPGLLRETPVAGSRAA